MGLPFDLPDYIRAPKTAWKRAVELECYGLCTECLGGVLIDDAYWLEGMEASGSFFLLPSNPKNNVDYRDASFIADCLAFEHEVPIAAFPLESKLKKTDLPWYHISWGIHGLSPKPHRNDAVCRFYQTLRDVFYASNTMTNGLSFGIVFRHDPAVVSTETIRGYPIARVSYASKYQTISSALHLYNSALRQPEPLFQYLAFYRVIECCSQNNGKAWIENKLVSRSFDYTHPIWCEFHSGMRSLSVGLRRKLRRSYISNGAAHTNLLEIMRAQALQRLDSLTATTSQSGIARRLYNENRCGIAHGGVIRKHDLDDDFIEVLRDLPLIRYLARLGIEDKL